VNLYPFIAEILGLNAPVVDGTLDVLQPALKKRSQKAPVSH
jgi:hypothetical protein